MPPPQQPRALCCPAPRCVVLCRMRSRRAATRSGGLTSAALRRASPSQPSPSCPLLLLRCLPSSSLVVAVARRHRCCRLLLLRAACRAHAAKHCSPVDALRVGLLPPSQWVERGPRFGTSRHRLLGACRSVAAAVCCYCAPSVCRLRTESFAPSAMVACLGRERRALTPAFQRARVNPHEPTPHSPGTHTPLFSRFYPLHSDQVDNLVRCLERDGSSRGC